VRMEVRVEVRVGGRGRREEEEERKGEKEEDKIKPVSPFHPPLSYLILTSISPFPLSHSRITPSVHSHLWLHIAC